jgi:plastocyanin
MSPWDSLLELVSKVVSPDWGALIALIPLALAALVVAYLGWVMRRALTAPPIRTRPLPAAPTPAHIHGPGPSLAPFLAAAGIACFVLALLFVHVGPRVDPGTKQPIAGSTTWTIAPLGLLAIAIGILALVLGLLYWGREASREYDALDGPSSLPALIHSGPPAGVHVPGPSFRPLLLAVAASAMVLGGVLNVAIFLGGVVMLIIALLGWLRDARAEYRETVRADATGHLENIPAPRFPTGTLLAFGAIFAASVLIAAGIVPPSDAAAIVAASAKPSAATSASASAAGAPAASASAAASSAASVGPSAAPDASAPPPSGPGGSPAASVAADVSVTLQLAAAGIAYDKTDLEAPGNTPFGIAFANNDAGIPHNVSIHRDSAAGEEVFKGDIFNGTETRTYAVPALPAGTYVFVCTVHPNMTGTLTVK